MSLWRACGPLVPLITAMVLFAQAASAQECRRICTPDESRDGNGCCVARPAEAPEIRCPAGSSWSPRTRACVGRPTCPVGSHMESGRCINDAVACPAGSRSVEGRCTIDVTCPDRTRLENNRCIADVTCPPSTRLEGTQCISSDVTCPTGTRPREGGGCVATPSCPASTQYVEGRGCVGAITCPNLTHLDGEQCVPDHVCLDGQQFSNGSCTPVCASIDHSRWDSERRACICTEGFTVHEGRCERRNDSCPPGSHIENNTCVADVVCPYQYRFERGRGCIDPVLEGTARAERERRVREERESRERAEREAAEARAIRWNHGTTFQVFAGGGFGLLYSPQAYRLTQPNTTMSAPVGSRTTVMNSYGARTNGYGAFHAGVTLTGGDIAITAHYTYIPGQSTRTEAMTDPRTLWQIDARPVHLPMLTVAQQGTGAIHAWRFGLGIGWEISSGSLAAEFMYRSSFRLVAGLFLAIELRAIGLLQLAPGDAIAPEVREPTTNPTLMTTTNGMMTTINAERATNSPAPGGGGTATVLLGYSIY